MIRETKSTSSEDGRRGNENHKISCGKEHFKELNVYYDTAISSGDI